MPTREHIFKAKRKDNGEWVEGHYTNPHVCLQEIAPYLYPEVHAELTRHFILVKTLEYKFPFLEHEVDSETVCECTGLTDKNGKKIFEGDILSAHLDEEFPENETTVTVIWFAFGWYLQQGSFLPDKLEKSDGEIFEVIGNIYDNPELVEVEK